MCPLLPSGQVYEAAGSLFAFICYTCVHLLHLPTRSTTPGGGYGYLTPTHGLACDQLLSLTVVTANGSIVEASPSSHDDLFAASCGGGGGNFGA